MVAITNIQQLPNTTEESQQSWADKLPMRFSVEAEPLAYVHLMASVAAPVPAHVSLAFLRDGRLRVIAPISVAICVEDGVVVAEAEGMDEFGCGPDFTSAIVDLQQALSELYFALDEQREKLGPSLQKTWELLQSKIRPR